MSQGKKRIHHIMLSSDSETSDDESQYRTRANTIHMEGSNYEGSNLNNTVVSNMINEINELTDQNTRNQRTASTFNTSLNIVNIASTSPIQTSIEQYFATTDNLFHEINRLNENTSEFRIRCKVLYKSLIRQFGANSKMFDGIVCDMYEEIKKIIIENGQVRKADERYRTTNSMYEIRLFENSHVELYESNDFNPSVKIMKKAIISVSQLLHGAYVDVEGQIMMDRGIFTTTSENNDTTIRRRLLKIKDETGAINITLWNKKIDEIPDMVLDQNIRIRRGKINHFNDYVSINVSEQSIIQIY
ncbi:unnamed protein product [Rotaria sordida]|uniref:OB domain-containing protein n=1 Tax=Rotaria sordida TaxID=392033 RepID=A0A815IRT4_9BILA|nr:unnamed protein product [Rotaria sordida]